MDILLYRCFKLTIGKEHVYGPFFGKLMYWIVYLRMTGFRDYKTEKGKNLDNALIAQVSWIDKGVLIWESQVKYSKEFHTASLDHYGLSEK